eukprot:gene23116-29309_t
MIDNICMDVKNRLYLFYGDEWNHVQMNHLTLRFYQMCRDTCARTSPDTTALINYTCSIDKHEHNVPDDLDRYLSMHLHVQRRLDDLPDPPSQREYQTYLCNGLDGTEFKQCPEVASVLSHGIGSVDFPDFSLQQLVTAIGGFHQGSISVNSSLTASHRQLDEVPLLEFQKSTLTNSEVYESLLLDSALDCDDGRDESDDSSPAVSDSDPLRTVDALIGSDLSTSKRCAVRLTSTSTTMHSDAVADMRCWHDEKLSTSSDLSRLVVLCLECAPHTPYPLRTEGATASTARIYSDGQSALRHAIHGAHHTPVVSSLSTFRHAVDLSQCGAQRDVGDLLVAADSHSRIAAVDLNSSECGCLSRSTDCEVLVQAHPEPHHHAAPRSALSSTFMYTVPRHTETNAPSSSEPSVLVDSGAAINVAPSASHVIGAVSNKDPRVGILAINGGSMTASHTAYHNVVGNTIVVPGVTVALASVAELTKHGNTVTFPAFDGTFTITSQSGKSYSGVLNGDNIFEMKLSEYQRLQAESTKSSSTVNFSALTSSSQSKQHDATSRHLSGPPSGATLTSSSRPSTGPSPIGALSTSSTSRPIGSPVGAARPTGSLIAPASNIKRNAVTRAAAHVGSVPATVYTVEQRARAAQIHVLHICLSHPSDSTLMKAFDNGTIVGTHLTSRDVIIHRAIYGVCTACAAGKITKPSYTSSNSVPADCVGHTIHVDIYVLKDRVKPDSL